MEEVGTSLPDESGSLQRSPGEAYGLHLCLHGGGRSSGRKVHQEGDSNRHGHSHAPR